MIIRICVGSACHLKGSPEIVDMLQAMVAEHQLEDRVTLTGSLCIGQCHTEGITVQVDDEVFPGITKNSCREFFIDHVLSKL